MNEITTKKINHLLDILSLSDVKKKKNLQSVKRIEGKVWNCIIPTSKLPECEMRLRIINQRGEDHNQVSIRYLSEHLEIDESVTTEPRLEDLYLWLFPQTDLEKEDR